jgi:hypothetical protein
MKFDPKTDLNMKFFNNHYNPRIMLPVMLVCFATVMLLSGQNVSAQKQKNRALVISELELGYPSPGIPFYHFRADLELPESSIIEVEAAVDGKVLRATEIKREDQLEDLNKPPLSERPPSGYSMSQDGTHYKNPHVIGWVKWQPGQTYTVKITVRMKRSVHASDQDVMLSAEKQVTAPSGISVFDDAWPRYKSVVVSETGGIDRENEPVEVLLAFYPDEALHLTREIRVVAVHPETHALTEVVSQVYDIQKYLEEDDMAPDDNGQPTRDVPLWMPTVTARVAFLGHVPAKSSRVFLVYYGNEDAMAKTYQTDLQVQGERPGLLIENDRISVVLHPESGHLDQITLKSRTEDPLFHRMETNGAIHWNPGIYVPPRAWTHTADWKPPANVNSVAGPVISTNEMWDHLRGVPEVDASVRYEFYPGMPYFISSTSMRINETVHCLAMRNAEIVFKRELMTHASWYDIVRDSIITYNVSTMPDLTDIKMEADVPWITFFNAETGIGFAGIQLGYDNSGIETRTRLLNPFFYITGGPWIYWARGLSHPFLSSNMQQVVPALKGSVFSEKWAYLIYEIDKGDKPYAPVLDWHHRLIHPLRVQVVEEVDERVSRTVVEIYMDEGRSGWEERETGKHGKEE